MTDTTCPKPNYKKLYFDLFNAITDALELPDRDEIASACLRLASAQYFAEEEYLDYGE